MTLTAPQLTGELFLEPHAVAYAEAGLEVFPLRPDKAPLTSNGLYAATSDIEQVKAWWAGHPEALIGCRVPPDVVILDIDPRSGGLDTWQALKDTFGAILPTRNHMSGRGDGGGHIWFRLETDSKLSTKRLDEWAKIREVGHPIGDNGKWGSGIDLLHHGLRYTILPPSPHPATGAPYTWASAPNQLIAPAPDWLINLLTPPPPPPPVPPALASLTQLTRTFNPSESPAQWFTDNHSWRDVLEPHGWQLVKGDGDSDDSHWRHPAATSPVSATTRHNCLFVYSPNTPFEVTEPGDASGYTRFAAYALLEHRGDQTAAATAILKTRNPKPVPPTLAAAAPAAPLDPLTGQATLEPAATEPATEIDPARWLPAAFWDTNPQLAHIKQAAQARRVSPDAVLIACLARIAALTPHTVTLPPSPTPMGLTSYAVIAGPPGTGKSAAMGVAKHLLPAPETILDGLPIGSGEGMIESFFTWRTEEDPETGKPQRVKRQTFHAAIFQADEGEVLADLGSRSGSTLLPMLRSAYTGSDLGQTNASDERRRILPAGSYALGFTMGIQPERAEAFLGDAGGGTPQRFLWAEATYPWHPDNKPDWPGPLSWKPPTTAQLIRYRSLDLEERHELRLDPSISAEVDAHQLAVNRGEIVISEDEAHAKLVQLKTAGLLALLEGTLDVGLDHWAMALAILETSTTVRSNVRSTIAAAASERLHAQHERAARRELHIQTTREAELLGRAARIVTGAIARHTSQDAHSAQGGGCTRKCLNQAMGRRYRDHFTIEDVADIAASYDWIREQNGRWILGESRPT